MTDLAVACVWVHAHRPYPSDYVPRLQACVARHLKRPHRFVCLTDRPDAVPCEAIPVALPPKTKGWWAKIELFNPLHEQRLGARVLYLDLDTLPVAPLDDIVDFPAPFALIPDGAPEFLGRDGLRVIKRYNSSVMVWDAGAGAALHRDWSPAEAKRLWSDQDWIAEQCDAATMPIDWFPRLSALEAGPPFPPATRVILAKKPKNHLAAVRWPWFASLWG